MNQRLHQLAYEKAVRLLGEGPGERLLRAVLRECRLEQISTPDELMQVANTLKKRQDTFEIALGAILGFQATVYGSQPADK